jgi:hypothetical protein
MNWARAAIFATISLLLAGCATNRVVVDSYCQSYEEIKASRKDTAGTLRQVLRENNKHRSVCGTPK